MAYLFSSPWRFLSHPRKKLQGAASARLGAWHARFPALGDSEGSPRSSSQKPPRGGICVFGRVACSKTNPWTFLKAVQRHPRKKLQGADSSAFAFLKAVSSQKTPRGGICAFGIVAYSISGPWRFLKAVQRHPRKKLEGAGSVRFGAWHARFPALGGS